ncbi:HAD family hydrolase [Rhizobium sp. L1K21]|uniref:HAD family hydrolase n=1 Tax=Rhizobium sp. L1K21 TaxID=2954933 RepID=UPI00209366A2|nr:HAD family hydrolase [Rhizobium sp. L1K21]MCO6186963.1 HAD family hydrolase [Rhizobium sp. L1K21]
MKIAGILFDKDGTLLDYARSWVPVNRQLTLMAAGGDQALADHLMRVGGMDPESGVVLADSLLAAGNTAEIARGLVDAGAVLSYEDMLGTFDTLFASASEMSVPVTDLKSFFSGLKARGLKTGIASSDNERSIRALAQRFDFLRDVDYIAGYDTGYGCKPEPGMALGFCEVTGLDAGAMIVVGDNSHDMHMGRSAGAGMTIGVLTGTGTRQTLSPLADHVFDDITSLHTLLDAE